MNMKFRYYLFTLFILGMLNLFSQAPQLISYQAIARDGLGNIITSGTIGLRFRILQGSAAGTVSYSESNSATPSSVGIFTAAIGAGTPLIGSLSSVNWSNGPFFIEVGIDPSGGTSYSTVGVSQMMSVPYALYAASAGGSSSLPTGTLTGQTLYWNNVSNTWVTDNSVLNNGSQVSIGGAIVGNNRVKITSSAATDSAALFVYHPNSVGDEAAVRGYAWGASSNSGSITVSPIIGGHFVGNNILSSGTALGVLGQGISPSGDAVGMVAIGSSSSTSTGRSIGLYATSTGSNGYYNYSGVFDKGKVLINDTIVVGMAGNTGDVLTRGTAGKTYWAPGGSSGPWGQGVGTVTLSTSTDNVLIGTTSSAAKLNIGTSVGFAGNDLQVTSLGNGDACQLIKPVGVGAGLRVVNASSTSTAAVTISSTSGNPVGLEINIAGNNSALNAISNGTAPTVAASNNSSGHSVSGVKSGINGNAGYFENTLSASSADAVLAITSGTGAAIHAKNGTSTSSSLAMLIDNGHIKAVGPTIGVTSTSVTGGFSSIVAPTCSGCNDVRGTVSFTTGVTGFSTTNFADVTITFFKPYTTPPNITLTSLTDMQDLSYGVANVTTTYFVIRIYRSSNKSIPTAVPNSSFKFNYLVIE